MELDELIVDFDFPFPTPCYSEANRVLSDANDCFSSNPSVPPHQQQIGGGGGSGEMSCQNSLTSCQNSSEEDEGTGIYNNHSASIETQRSLSLSTIASNNALTCVDTDKGKLHQTPLAQQKKGLVGSDISI
jgi:hypothetical protein